MYVHNDLYFDLWMKLTLVLDEGGNTRAYIQNWFLLDRMVPDVLYNAHWLGTHNKFVSETRVQDDLYNPT